MGNHHLTIIYTDDEVSLLELGKLFLERFGNISVDIAPSAQEALEKISIHTYDCVVSDYQMPGMDGIQFLQEVRKRFGDLPFILFTGRGREEVVIQALNHGADFYLQKGGEPKSQFVELEHKIRQAVSRKQTEKALAESERISRVLLDATTDAVALINGDLQILSVNEAFSNRFHQKPETMIGLDIHTYVPLELSADRRSWIEEVIRSKRPVRYEDQRGVLFLENSLYPIFDERGEVNRVAVFSRDITDRKTAEQNLRAAYEKIAADEEELREKYDELSKSENQIRESEERFRGLTENALDTIMLFDRNLRHLYVNPNVELQTGIPARDFIGKTHAEMGFPPDLVHLWEGVLQEVFASKTTSRVEFQLPSGLWIDWLAAPVLEADGTVGQVITSARDISERKIAEDKIRDSEELLKENYQKLLRSEQRLADIINFAPDATLAIDQNGIVTAWNHAMEELTGIRAVDIIGKGDFEYSIPFYGTRRPLLINLTSSPDSDLEDQYSHISREGETLTAETVVRLSGGKEMVVWAKASPLYDEHHTLIGAIESLRDITEWRNTSTALKKSEAWFKSLFNQAFQLAAVLDLSGKLIQVNQTALDIIGKKVEEVVGIPFQDTPWWAHDAQVQDKIQSAIDRANKGEIVRFETSHIDSSGNIHIIDFSLKPITDADGKVTALLPEGRDITLLKNAEEEVRREREKFKHLFDLAPYACSLTDKEGIVLLVNKSHEKLTGYPSSEIEGKKQDESVIFTHDDLERLREKMKEQGYLEGEEVSVRIRDGKIRKILLSSTVIPSMGEKQYLSTMIDITERRIMEEQLRKTSEQISGIAETIPGVIYQFFAKESGEKGLYYVSRRALEIFGIEGDLESFFPSFTRHVHDEDREPFLSSIDKAVENASRWEFEGRFVKSVGELVYFRGISAPVRVGSELVFSGVLLDVTAQKAAEGSLVESEVRYRSLFNSAVDAILLMKDEKFIDCNPAALSLYGCTREEILGHSPIDFSPLMQPDGATSREAAKKQIAAAYRGESPLFEWVHITRSGRPFHAEVALRAISIGGSPHLLAYVRNISLRKNAENALQKERIFTRLLLDTSPAFIVAIGTDGKTLMMNQLLLDALEYSAEDVKGKDYLTTFVPESDREELSAVFHRIVYDNCLTRNENHIVSRSGKEILVQWRGRPVKGAEGEMDFFIGVGIDITQKEGQ